MKNFDVIGDFLSNIFNSKEKEEEETPNMADLCYQLCLHVKYQQDRIEKLEEENVETTNTLYEVMHSIEALDARIDIIHAHNETEKEEMERKRSQQYSNELPNF